MEEIKLKRLKGTLRKMCEDNLLYQIYFKEEKKLLRNRTEGQPNSTCASVIIVAWLVMSHVPCMFCQQIKPPAFCTAYVYFLPQMAGYRSVSKMFKIQLLLFTYVYVVTFHLYSNILLYCIDFIFIYIL